MTVCHICKFPHAEELGQDGAPLKLVSSDVRAVVGRTNFLFCPNCGGIQKAVTPQWQAMVDRVYASYDINHQSQGAEPMIFDSAKGSGPRSMILLRSFLDVAPLPAAGRLLDIGCSNGNLLKSFHALRPAWKLSGSELLDTWKETVLALPNVERFYSGPNPAYEGPFDLISLSHVLEHIPHPIAFLTTISKHLAERGRILLAVPDFNQNPSDLIIADHCTHYDSRSLAYVFENAGLAVESMSARLLPKELVAIIAKPADAAASSAGTRKKMLAGQPDSKVRCLSYFKLLDDVRRAAKIVADRSSRFGIMGSSIAACWTALELSGGVDFFVDEDPHRVGHELMGLPILGPSQLPEGATVFIPMSVPVARKIIGRWRHLPVQFEYVASNEPT